MKQKFGDSGISREMYGDSDWFDSPIDMSKVSDEGMYKLVDSVESIIREKYPSMADKLFAYIANEGFTDDDEDKIINYSDGDMWSKYWELLRIYAVVAGGIDITDDDDDDDDDDIEAYLNDDEDTDVDDDDDLGDLGINQTAIATESFVADLRILRLDIDDILDSLPYNKALTMRLRAIDRKLADIADDFSSLKATIDFLGEQR